MYRVILTSIAYLSLSSNAVAGQPRYCTVIANLKTHTYEVFKAQVITYGSPKRMHKAGYECFANVKDAEASGYVKQK
jgi:hypothetical protein